MTYQRSKICQWCNNYDKKEYRCIKKKIPVSNVHTCDSWVPLYRLLVGNEKIEFVDYYDKE